VYCIQVLHYDAVTDLQFHLLQTYDPLNDLEL